MLRRTVLQALGLGGVMGGLPLQRPDQVFVPHPPALGAGSRIGVLVKLIVANSVISSAGMFFYNGTPALGNLIESVGVSQAGTDPKGNAYLAGDTTYTLSGGTFYAASSNGASVKFLRAAAAGGPWLNSGAIFDGNTLGSPGTIFVNTTLLVTTVTPIISGAAETWHALALLNGWTGTARYRLLPDGRVELDVVISSAAATAAQFTTIASAFYQPTATRNIAAGATANVAAGQAPYVSVTAAGVVSMNGLAAFSAAGTFVAGGSYPLN